MLCKMLPVANFSVVYFCEKCSPFRIFLKLPIWWFLVAILLLALTRKVYLIRGFKHRLKLFILTQFNDGSRTGGNEIRAIRFIHWRLHAKCEWCFRWEIRKLNYLLFEFFILVVEFFTFCEKFQRSSFSLCSFHFCEER